MQNNKLFIKYTSEEILPKLTWSLLCLILLIQSIDENKIHFSIFAICCLLFLLVKIVRCYKINNSIKKGHMIGFEITDHGIVHHVGKFSGIELNWIDIETITFNSLKKSLCILLKPNSDYISKVSLYKKFLNTLLFKKSPSKICHSLFIYGKSSEELEDFFRAHIEENLIVI